MMRTDMIVTATAATLLWIAMPALSDDIFNQADGDGNGTIDSEEFRAHMVDTFYLAVTVRDRVLEGGELDVVNRDRLPDADKNGDGMLDLREFLNTTNADFDARDRNGNDSLDPGEL